MTDKELATIEQVETIAPIADTRMPKLGEVRKSSEIGKRSYCHYIWSACVDCGKERWVQVNRKRPQRHCYVCGMKARRPRDINGKRNPAWRGGRIRTSCGYIRIWLPSDHPFYPMATQDGYIREHRLVVAQRLGRCLLPSEKVHHVNGIRDDNRDENLKLVSPADHRVYTDLCRTCELRREIRLLRWQVKELAAALQGKLEAQKEEQ